ncbi:MAG: response regulator, partial [Gammaproteobacteria bacterium]|nr:response regulator [Gammaproteobacteria bacterium]
MTKKVSLKSILILDDDQEFRALLKSLLLKSFPDVEIHEYDPIEKGEPEDGFDWSVFDVLILDHYLCVHGLTGLDLFQKHQKSPDFPPTIMLTGAGNERLALRAFKSGIKDYIHKNDLNAAVLSEAINKASEEHYVEQNAQHEIQVAENQIQEDRLKLEKQAAAVKVQLENIEQEKQSKQEGIAEVERIKSEAEAQIQKEREDLAKEAADVKA